jgi:hypothetical protein
MKNPDHVFLSLTQASHEEQKNRFLGSNTNANSLMIPFFVVVLSIDSIKKS